MALLILLATLTLACVGSSPGPDGAPVPGEVSDAPPGPDASLVSDRALSPYDVVLRDLLVRDDTWTNRAAGVIVLPKAGVYDPEDAEGRWFQAVRGLDETQLAEVAEFEPSFSVEHLAEVASLDPSWGVALRARDDEHEVLISFSAPFVSDDGRAALVRFSFAPWIGDHSAAGSSLLRRASDGGWELAWTRVSRFL